MPTDIPVPATTPYKTFEAVRVLVIIPPLKVAISTALIPFRNSELEANLLGMLTLKRRVLSIVDSARTCPPASSLAGEVGRACLSD